MQRPPLSNSVSSRSGSLAPHSNLSLPPHNYPSAPTATNSTSHLINSTQNPYDLVHMTTPAAHRSLLRLTIASLLLQSRAPFTTTPCMSCLASVLTRLVEVLCKHAMEGGVEALVWVCGTLSRQHHLPNMLLYDLRTKRTESDENEEEEEELSGIAQLMPIMYTLVAYARAAKEAELKGPSGLRDGVAKDALQIVGLIPADYKLLHHVGRVDEQSIVNTMSVLQ